MRVKLDPDLLKKLKRLNVRIRNRFRERILLFSKNPNNPKLNNHPLKREYQGLRSIDITADYRAIYEETREAGETIMYFFLLGAHQELYGQR